MNDFINWFSVTYSPDGIWANWKIIIISYTCWFLIERIIPARKQSTSNILGNLFVTFIYLTLASSAGMLMTIYINKIIPTPLIKLHDLMHPIVALILFVIIADFFFYWFHRLAHVWQPLWRIHKLHHSDRNLNVSTTLRNHWLEEPIRAVITVAPISALVNISPIDGGIFAALLAQWSYFIHANVKIPFGFFTKIVCGPQVHRVHHSIGVINKNFAAFLPIYDILFGTYLQPDSWHETGLSDHNGALTFKDVIFVGSQSSNLDLTSTSELRNT